MRKTTYPWKHLLSAPEIKPGRWETTFNENDPSHQPLLVDVGPFFADGGVGLTLADPRHEQYDDARLDLVFNAPELRQLGIFLIKLADQLDGR